MNLSNTNLVISSQQKSLDNTTSGAVSKNNLAQMVINFENEFSLSEFEQEFIDSVRFEMSERDEIVLSREAPVLTSVDPTVDFLAGIAELDELPEEDRVESFMVRFQAFQNYYQEVSDQILFISDTSRNIQTHFKDLVKRIESLKECDRLSQEKEKYFKIEQDIRKRLSFFEPFGDFEKDLKPEFIGSKQYSVALSKLDDSIRFLSNNMDFYEAKKFLLKYRETVSKSMNEIRNHILQNFSETSLKCNTLVKEEKEKGILQEILYIQFKVSSEPMKALIGEMEKRREYNVLLNDCFDAYFNARRNLLYPILSERFTALFQQDLVTLIRSGCSYMIQTCIQENQLFRHFFSSDSLDIKSLIEVFASILYEGLRTVIVQIHDLDKLSDVVKILKNEILNEALKPRGNQVVAFESTVLKMIQDVQERLIFKAFQFVTEKISNFVPKDEDLDYPDKLKVKDTQGIYQDCYPTLEITMRFLNKMYSSLDKGIIQGLAQTTVSACIQTLLDASNKIKEKKGYLDGQLFFIKHLLLLREQLTSFDVSFASVEINLNFSHITNGITKFLQGKSSFKLSSLIYDIMAQTSPKIVLSAMDSKKDLDQQINSACESFIMNVTRMAFDPIFLFCKKMSVATEVANSSQILEVFEKIRQPTLEMMENLQPKLDFYLSKTNNANNILTPIQGILINTYGQFLDIASKTDVEMDKLWSASTFKIQIKKE